MFARAFAPAMTDDLLRFVEHEKPDLIVHEVAALAGAVLSRVLEVPAVAHGYGVLRPPDAFDFF
jgi:formate-dependent phosphoribosylglycinamide formyltransferase (GAR transformylase)